MDDADTDYLGTEAQRALLKRGRAMFDAVGDDPDYTYYGRTVGLAMPEGAGITRLAGLAALQGNAAYGSVPVAAVPGLRKQAEDRGLVVAHYARWTGAGQALARAKQIIAETPLQADLTLSWIDADTSETILSAFAQMATDCGVLPPSLGVLTGRLRPGLGLVAVDPSGQVVCCAAAAAFLQPGHPDARTECWWGMLATRPDWRGYRLSLILGARAMVEMQVRYGFTRYFTGVEPGNAASEAICARLGLTRSEEDIFGVADRALLPSGRMTK